MPIRHNTTSVNCQMQILNYFPNINIKAERTYLSKHTLQLISWSISLSRLVYFCVHSPQDWILRPCKLWGFPLWLVKTRSLPFSVVLSLTWGSSPAHGSEDSRPPQTSQSVSLCSSLLWNIPPLSSLWEPGASLSLGDPQAPPDALARTTAWNLRRGKQGSQAHFIVSPLSGIRAFPGLISNVLKTVV